MKLDELIQREGLRLLHEGAPPLKQISDVEDWAQPGNRVFIAARHQYVKEILCDDTRFSLQHYDRLLAEVAGSTRYLVTDDALARERRLSMLQCAQQHVMTARGGGALGPSPQLAAEYRQWIARVTRREARQVLAILQARRSGDRVNFVREYAYLVAYRVARQVVGVPGPERPPSFAWLLMTWRNLSTPGRWITLRGELGASASFMALMHPLFGHVFGTIVRSPSWIRVPARWASRQSLELLDAALAMTSKAPPFSLLRALDAARQQFTDIPSATYDEDVRSILFELASALLLIVGKSLSDCAAFLVSPEGSKAGTSWHDVVRRLSGDAEGYEAHDAVIYELMRFAGAARLSRTVRATTTFHGVEVKQGDRILALVNLASLDPAAFPNPYVFQPGPGRPYLTSGPLDGKHACYGRALALTVMREALVEASKLIEPVPGARPTLFAGLPDDMPWTFVAPPVATPWATARHRMRSPRLSGRAPRNLLAPGAAE